MRPSYGENLEFPMMHSPCRRTSQLTPRRPHSGRVGEAVRRESSEMCSAQRPVHSGQLGLKLLPARQQRSELALPRLRSSEPVRPWAPRRPLQLACKACRRCSCASPSGSSRSPSRCLKPAITRILRRVAGQGLKLGALGLSRQQTAGAFRKHCRQARRELKLLLEGTRRHFHSWVRLDDQRRSTVWPPAVRRTTYSPG